MPTRRHFLAGALAPLVLPARAFASPRCVADPKHGGELCKTFVDVQSAYQETYYARREPAAVWVACVAVVLATYGHVIQQPRIIKEAYGDIAAISLDGLAAAKPLERRWKDDDGASFSAAVEAVFDADAQAARFDQDALIAAVANGDPLILMGGGHPVVLTALAFAKGDSPERTVFHGVTETIKNSEIT